MCYHVLIDFFWKFAVDNYCMLDCDISSGIRFLYQCRIILYYEKSHYINNSLKTHIRYGTPCIYDRILTQHIRL